MSGASQKTRSKRLGTALARIKELEAAMLTINRYWYWANRKAEVLESALGTLSKSQSIPPVEMRIIAETLAFIAGDKDVG